MHHPRARNQRHRGGAKRPPGGPSHETRSKPGRVVGRLQHRGSFAFLLVDGPGAKDLFIQGPSLALAMDGDTVEAVVRGRSRGRPLGEIVRVLERSRRPFVGSLRRERGLWYLDDPERLLRLDVEGFADGLTPRVGDLASASITRWPDGVKGAAGTVTEIFGEPGAPGVRLAALLRARGVPDGYPKAVLRSLKDFPETVTQEMAKGRRRIFDLPHFTIDGADAKDFDDAVSLEPLSRGRWRLGVHIADVSYYVRPGTELDAEAKERATSVYLPGRVVPMLPPQLSDGLCSLVPDEPRLSFTCWLEMDDDGRVHSSRFEETVMRSRRRFTYEEVQVLLDGGEVDGVDEDIKACVLSMGVLARKVTAERLSRGALDFDMPEYKVLAGLDGNPTAIEKRPRLASHRLIEEFMILANEASARELIDKRLRGPHRVHERPDPAKLAALTEDLRRLGVNAPRGLAKGRDLPLLFKQIDSHPLRDVMMVMAMRSLKQAVYSADPGPHFGLASRAYTHFTSPIRRYPDLMVHRAIKGEIKASREEMAQWCAHSSERERRAAETERQSVSLLRLELLSRDSQAVYDGIVTRNERFGAIVELAGNGAIGVLRTGNFRPGQRVRVRAVSVQWGRRELDLALVGGGSAGPSRREPRRERRR